MPQSTLRHLFIALHQEGHQAAPSIIQCGIPRLNDAIVSYLQYSPDDDVNTLSDKYIRALSTAIDQQAPLRT